MSVVIELSRIDLVSKLQAFWDQVPNHRSLTAERTQILPAFIGGIDHERVLTLLKLYVEKGKGWIYDDIAITPDQIWSNQFFPQVPMWAVTTFRDVGPFANMNRSILYRSDLIVPPLVVLLNEEQHLQKFDPESTGLCENATFFNWKETTQTILRVTLGIGDE
jgi:hypothetical protein